MDEEEEEEDNINRIYRSNVPATLVIIKSNMIEQPHYRQRNFCSRQPKPVDKYLLLLLALLFSNFQFRFVRAHVVNQFNVSRFPSRPSHTLEEYRDASERQMRHDAVKNTANKRLISSDPISNSVPDYEDDAESIRNTSVQYLRDESFRDDVADWNGENGVSVQMSISNATAEKLSSPKYDSCSCFGGKKKVSRGFHGLTISVQHRVLNTSEGITAGIVYQGKMFFRYTRVNS